MAKSMFCPLCRALLSPIMRNNAPEWLCPNCGDKNHIEPENAASRRQPRTGALHIDYPLFPYEKVRGGQRQFMEDLRTALENGRVMLAQAPTGIGKTAAALSVTLEYSLKNGKKTLFLTSKQSQHWIVIETIRKIAQSSGRRIKAVDIIAKQAMCPRAKQSIPSHAFSDFCYTSIKSHSCPFYESDCEPAVQLINSEINHVEELKRLCTRMRVCPYKAAMEAVPGTDIVVCDYNYIFDIMRDRMEDRVEGGLGGMVLIIDEAHNLPDRIRSNLSRELSSYGIAEAVDELGEGAPRWQRYTSTFASSVRSWVKGMQVGGEEYIQKERLTLLLDKILSETIREKDSFENYIEWLERTGTKIMLDGIGYSHAMELAEFLRGWCASGDECARIIKRGEGDSWRLNLYHMDPSTMGKPVFSEVHAAVLMSGTLCPSEMYADILGIPKDKLEVKTYASPFPPENRLILATDWLNSGWAQRGESMYLRYAQAITEISRTVPGNVGAFFPSYSFMESVSEKLAAKISPKRIVIRETKNMTKEDRLGVLKTLRTCGGRALLMAVQGGSLGEGIDYENNLLSALIIAGLPFAPPNKEVTALRNYYLKYFGQEKGDVYGYYGPAFNKVVQSAGRLIRSEKDRGIIVLMDERILHPKYSNLLPPDMNPNVVRRADELAAAASVFFSKSPRTTT